MWHLSLPWWEFVLRALIVYGFVILILRLTGKRQIGQMSPFDLVLLLVLSNAVQNSMNGGDNSVSGGMILAGTLVAINALLGYLTFKSKTIENIIEGEPEVLVFNGKVINRALIKEGLTMDELEGAMRAAGCDDVSKIHLATMEQNGQISIVCGEHSEHQGPKVRRTPRPPGKKGRRRGN